MVTRLRDWFIRTFSNADGARLAMQNLELIQEKRELEEELEQARERNEELIQQNVRLQDRADFMEATQEKLWGLVNECRAEVKEMYQAEQNVSWQTRGYGVKYPGAPHIERKEVAPDSRIGIGARQLPSDLERRKTDAFIKHYTGKVAEQVAEKVKAATN